MTGPSERPTLATRSATAATLRTATLGPYEVIVLAAVEALSHESHRMTLPTLQEISTTSRVDAGPTLDCLGSLRRQRLVSGDGEGYALTPLGVEILAELIRREKRKRRR